MVRTLGESVLGIMLTGKGVVRAGKVAVRSGRGKMIWIIWRNYFRLAPLGNIKIAKYLKCRLT